MDCGLASLTQSTIAFIPHEGMFDATRRLPGLAAILWRETLIEATVFRQWIVGMGQRSAYGRMARLFCELYCRLEAVGLAADHRCTLPITQGELADALGLSDVHVNRVLQEMRAENVITLHARTLTINAWDKLARASEFDPSYLNLDEVGRR